MKMTVMPVDTGVLGTLLKSLTEWESQDHPEDSITESSLATVVT